MTRPWHVSAVFGACLVVGLAAAAWITLTAAGVERDAREKAALEENVRVALWRMESALAPLISRESSRPAYAYEASYSPPGAFNDLTGAYAPGDVLVPSPLAGAPPEDVRLYFQIEPNGRWSSPEERIDPKRLSGKGQATDDRSAEFHALVPASILIAAVQAAVTLEPAVQTADEAVPYTARPPNSPSYQQQKQVEMPQSARNLVEQQRRSAQVLMNTDNRFQGAVSDDSIEPQAESMRAVWVNQELVLARRVRSEVGDAVQGAWLDWPKLRTRLLGEVIDLFPAADLRPFPDGAIDTSRALVSLPVQLVPGPTAIAVAGGGLSVRWSLVIAWSAMALAAVAVGGLLLGTLALSERRAAFVSAVTHELRTPLTTFRLYTDLLSSGRADDATKRREYADTLSGEARRLSHLVENVLTYARLERGRSTATLEVVPLESALERLRPTLEQRLAQASLSLVLHDAASPPPVAMHTDLAAVERILLNLIDNSCKYASSSEPRIVRVDVTRSSRQLQWRIRDYGPGIPQRMQRRLFHPFARPAGSTAPGVGLGLALCQRLALHIGGELRLDRQVTDGAAFVLHIPLVDAASGRTSVADQ